MTATSYEKLGAFYLGREVDARTGADKPDLLLYDSRDLTTHAVVVGMIRERVSGGGGWETWLAADAATRCPTGW